MTDYPAPPRQRRTRHRSTAPMAALAMACALLASAPGRTQSPPAAGTPAAAVAAAPAATTMSPFIAQYQVYKDGSVLGDATMQVVRNDARRWRVDLNMHGTQGLVGLAGINAEQSTVFDIAAGAYRPLAQSTLRKSVFTRKQTVGVYDWRAGQARWTGDVKETRRAPIALQPGDQSGLLINLAVIRDAAPGKALQYRFVDDGRVRDHLYNVSTDLEEVKVGELNYTAMRVTRIAGNEENTIWVVDGVPTPIRMLQREDGHDTYDLRLVEYKGVQ